MCLLLACCLLCCSSLFARLISTCLHSSHQILYCEALCLDSVCNVTQTDTEISSLLTFYCQIWKPVEQKYLYSNTWLRKCQGQFMTICRRGIQLVHMCATHNGSILHAGPKLSFMNLAPGLWAWGPIPKKLGISVCVCVRECVCVWQMWNRLSCLYGYGHPGLGWGVFHVVWGCDLCLQGPELRMMELCRV